MGTLQQQSVLKGLQTGWDKEKDLVHELFVRAAAVHPNKTAIYYEDTTGQEHMLSFDELDKITNRLARALRKYDKFGASPHSSSQSFVAVCVKPSDRLPTMLLAILKAGMAYLPLDAEFPMSRVKHILEEAQPLMVLAEEGADLSIYEGALVVTYEQLLEEAKREQEDSLAIAEETADQLAIVLYTSGSTGIPKGVLIPHATLLNRLQWQWRELPFADDEERCVFKTSLTFVDSVPEIWGPLLQGRTLVVMPKNVTKDPERFVPLLEKHGIQRLVLVPSLLRSLLMYLGLQDNDNVLDRLGLWICSGETLPVTLADQFFATFGDNVKTLANFYGSTEVMGDVTYHLLSNRAQLQGMEKVPIGKPVDNCIIYLVNKDMRLVPQGEVGELIVAGRNLAAGYIRGRDAHKFLDNPHAIDPDYPRIFHTGDYAKIVKGSVVYEGRVDSQIKIRGHRVDLTEVERAIARIPDIDKVVVLCYKPGELSQALVAFITIGDDATLSSSDIENLLQRTLPPYMLPQIVIIDSVPLLTNGKTDRQALLKQYESSCPNDENEVAANCDYSDVPSQDLAKAHVLFPTIASVIGRNSRALVTSRANFYELGGNSLNSIYTVTKLRDQGYQISITDFITAKSLTNVLDHMKLISSEEEPLKETIDQKSYIFEPLNDRHKEDVIKIITESFYSKADLEQWLMPDITRADYRNLMDAMWQPLVEKGLSFAMKSAQTGKTIGVTLNFDLWDEPELVLNSKLMIIFDFLEYLEGPIREYKLPKGKGQIIHNFMMTTSSELNAAENVLIMRQMEEYCLELAKQKKYAGIFTTNTSPLTQQLGTDVYGYESMLVYQVNKYEAPDSSKPFGKAPDSQLAICSLKMIN
ncbi:mycosubtilin synthase subunit C [Odontomachus brunneus]|uniref:mycosubtilin synthase subunit C n=1 Tax=Odontomachus brunneus TaxID=486640 RepID=UPI0013F265A2|nr:mycosubtilin synthase subunit C [Odontomachus brunneus]XP_032666159.1 mycosubtilin synthase subunit C [Odontomachus brunneus]